MDGLEISEHFITASLWTDDDSWVANFSMAFDFVVADESSRYEGSFTMSMTAEHNQFV